MRYLGVSAVPGFCRGAITNNKCKCQRIQFAPACRTAPLNAHKEQYKYFTFVKKKKMSGGEQPFNHSFAREQLLGPSSLAFPALSLVLPPPP